MEKINFVNGQAPAINDTNLNAIQDNVENAINEVQESVNGLKETILYQNASGTYTNFTLNDSILNYKYFEVLFTYNGTQFSTGKIVAKNGNACLVAHANVYENSAYYLKTHAEPLTVSGVDVTRREAYVSKAQINASAIIGSTASGANLVYITHVLGYK
jgi:hypothetical protein